MRKDFRSTWERVENVLKRILPLFLLVLYSFFGAFIFHLIEEPHELRNREDIINRWMAYRHDTFTRIDFIYRNPNTSPRQRRLEVDDALLWLQERYGLEPETGDPKWNFWGAMFYSLTLYTTIGYGYQSPMTVKGKVATCIYSLFGIPLALLALLDLGYIIARLFIHIWAGIRFLCRLCRCKRRFNRVRGDDDQAETDGDLLSFPIWLIVLITVCWMLGSAGLFMLWEDWDYATSLYFTFISFSTIGLGDVVPSKYNYMLLACVFVLVGLALVSTVISLIQQKIDELMKGMKNSMDNQYQQVQVDGGEFGIEMDSDPQGRQAGMRRMLNTMPAGSRLLYKLMPNKKKVELEKYWADKAKMAQKATQTEQMLTQSWRLGSIDEEKRRSHDDINSLVLMCDF